MSGSIEVEHIIDVASISDQTELRGTIRLEQSGVKARISMREREAIPKEKRKEKRGEKIRAESKKISVEKTGASSVV